MRQGEGRQRESGGGAPGRTGDGFSNERARRCAGRRGREQRAGRRQRGGRQAAGFALLRSPPDDARDATTGRAARSRDRAQSPGGDLTTGGAPSLHDAPSWMIPPRYAARSRVHAIARSRDCRDRAGGVGGSTADARAANERSNDRTIETSETKRTGACVTLADKEYGRRTTRRAHCEPRPEETRGSALREKARRVVWGRSIDRSDDRSCAANRWTSSVPEYSNILT